MSDKDTRSAVEILFGVLRTPNSIYSADLDHAKLDASVELLGQGLIARPGTDADDGACGNDPPTRELTEREKRYGDVVAEIRHVARSGVSPRTRVRAAVLLLNWGES